MRKSGTYKIVSMNLNTDGIQKVDVIADKLGLSRSETLDRVLLRISDRTLLHHARMKPPTMEGSNGDNINGLQQTP